MLAKECKINYLFVQRAELKDLILSFAKDGVFEVLYPGYIYPENIAYLLEEGFNVTYVDANDFITDEYGNLYRTLYAITPSADISLSEDDLKMSRQCAKVHFNPETDLENECEPFDE